MRKRDLFRTGTAAPAAIVLLLAVGIAFELVRHSRLSIEKFGLRFWSGKVWDPVSGEFGAFPFLWGTLYSSLLALAIAAPISIGIAVFLSELSPGRLRRPLVFLTELLAAIPSIVYGLWGIFVLVPLVRRLEAAMPPDLRKLPFFTGPPLGVGMLAAALILAIMVIPFASAVAREVLRAVPRHSSTAAPGSRAPSSSASAGRWGKQWRSPWSSGTTRSSPCLSSRRSTRWPRSSPTSSPRPRTTST
jgi:phosphate transport system permease protein